MKIIINKRIGNDTVQFEVEEVKEKDAISRALFFVPSDYCNLCKKETRIVWGSNKATTVDGTFIYIKRKCLSCAAISTAGEYKTGGLYWKPFEVYKKPEYNTNGTRKPTVAQTHQKRDGGRGAVSVPDGDIDYPEEDINPDDIPF